MPPRIVLTGPYPAIVGQMKHRIIGPLYDRLPAVFQSNKQARINLTTGIGAAESGWYQYIGQNGGPALGFWDMEPATHDDIQANFIRFRPELKAVQDQILGGVAPQAALMETRLDYAVMMNAFAILRAPGAIPAADDYAGMSAFHKRWYNTPLGKADPVANLPFFRAAVSS